MYKPLKLVSLGGELKGCLRALGGVEVCSPSPGTWRPVVLGKQKGRLGKAEWKALAVAWAKQRHPTVLLRRTDRAKTDWADAAEALCLAEYARLTMRRREV